MNIPELESYEDQAIDAVVSVLNRAREALGERQTLKQLATSRNTVAPQAKVVLTGLRCPLVSTTEHLIRHTIEKKWRLTDAFMYILNYVGSSKDECSIYYYFEAVFSQPTTEYPIPQATVSVFFRLEDKQIVPEEVRGAPLMTFRIEGHHWDHDVGHVLLIPDWLLAVVRMKTNFFKRVEELRLY